MMATGYPGRTRPAEKRSSAGICCFMSRQSDSTSRREFSVGLTSVATVLILFFFTTVVTAVEEIDSGFELSHQDCTDVGSVTSEVFLGWPYTVDCSNILASDSAYYDWQYEEDFDIKCVIMNETDGAILKESSVTDVESMYYFDAAELGDPYMLETASANDNNAVFVAFLTNGDSCLKSRHTLHVIEATVPEPTCEEHVTMESGVSPQELVQGQIAYLECLATTRPLHLTEYNVTWYKDCNVINTTHHSAAENLEAPDIVGTLTIVPDFDSAGVYTCSVTYRGMTRFLSRTNVCVRNPPYYGEPVIVHVTPEQTKAKHGSDVTLTCGGTSGSPVTDLSFLMFWIKNDTSQNASRSFVCTMHYTKTEITDEDKHACVMSANSDEADKCFSSPAEAMADIAGGITRVSSTLTIRNFSASDEGIYTCRVVSTRDLVDVHFNVTVVADDSRISTEATRLLLIILPTIAGLILITLIIGVLYVCMRRGDIKKRWKESIRSTTKMKGGVQQRSSDGVHNLSASIPGTLAGGKELPAEA